MIEVPAPMRPRLALFAVLAAACGPREVKWSIIDPDRLDTSLQSLAGCVGDTDCIVVVDLGCHAFALNKRQAPAWWTRPLSEDDRARQPKCMPPRGETLYAARCGPRGLCIAVPP